jgi:hypothetical protein
MPERPGRPADVVGWVAVLLALPALGLVKINAADVPWHLATARLAAALGHWPTTNSFSYTFPDYPLYQQYPVFQATIYAVFKIAGWRGLSALLFVGCAGVLVLFVRAAGPLRRAAPFFLLWALVAFSLQTRTALRPDLLSLSCIALSVIAFDLYRERHRAFIAALPVIHWIWVNGHQLFVLSLALQALFVVHLLLARWGRLGVDRGDAALPVAPVVGALAASAALCLATPLGTRIVHVFAHTSGSVSHHRAYVQELAPVWRDPLWLVVALALVVPTALALWRSRRRWVPFEVGLWLITLAIGATAMRGLVYLTLGSGLILQRTLSRDPLRLSLSPVLRHFFRGMALALTAALMLAIVYHRWWRRPDELGAVQAGLGRSSGDWPDAAIAALEADPPPGHMLNYPWSLANALIWQWPEQPVFVDPRLEAYPRPFLVESFRSLHDDAALDRLLAAHQPSWIFAEHCLANQRERLVRLAHQPDWQLTYLDVQTLVLVRRTPSTVAYRARHPVAPTASPPGLLDPQDPRRARQLECYERTLAAIR